MTLLLFFTLCVCKTRADKSFGFVKLSIESLLWVRSLDSRLHLHLANHFYKHNKMNF